MKNVIYIFLFLLIASGCQKSVKQNWNNFKAYYNTHYNAKKFFEEGVEKNREQVADINPLYPVPVHAEPNRAGTAEFDKAIEGGAKILRDHNNSDFVEPAIAIIGKSYYYKGEYFSALEKFQELNSIAEGRFKQEAVVWQGLVLLQMKSHTEGISFLESEIPAVEEWDKELLAEAKTVLAEHYVEREDFETAAGLLDESIRDLADARHKARAWFLHGQLLEYFSEFDRALQSFSKVESLHPPYTLIFNARKKQAELLRAKEDYEEALAAFREMARDDKNIEERNELNYEIALTHQLSGNYEMALEIYQSILSNEIRPPDGVVKAKTYYSIGEVYRFQKPDFSLAAAYFDSAASQRADPRRLPEYFNASELASSFGEYKKVNQEIARIDSLLSLGNMNPAELDSALKAIQQQLENERLEELRRLREQQNVMTTVNQQQAESTTASAADITSNGFLNVRNQRQLQDAKLQFMAVWGDRPLADNWRRQSAIRGIRDTTMENDDNLAADGRGNRNLEDDDVEDVMNRYALDVSDIPVTEAAKDSMQQMLNQQFYRLANVFYLSLDMPDSAAVYYENVINRAESERLVAGSLYSLAEVELVSGNESEARKIALQLNRRFPESGFARRLNERFDTEITPFSLPDSTKAKTVDSILKRYLNPAEKARELRQYAMTDADPGQVPVLLYEAALNYMEAAKNTEFLDERINFWYQKMEEWEEQKSELQSLKDSASAALRDTTLAPDEQQYWQSIADSAISSPNLNLIYPYQGGYWDSTRTVLKQIEENYGNSNVAPRVKVLRESLEPPEIAASDNTEMIPEARSEDTNVPDETEAPTCTDMDVTPRVSGGMDNFLSGIPYPAWTDGVVMKGEIEYEFLISRSGEVLQYEQVSRMSRTGIPQAFEMAFENDFKFEPFESIDAGVIRCTVAFPIDLE